MYGRSAAIYDLLYTRMGVHDYAAESAELRRVIQAAVPSARTLLDVACGTGAHLQELRRWYSVEGVDLSAGMLEVARRRLPDVPLHQGDMRTFDLGRTFDAVTCLFSAIGYVIGPGEPAATIGRLAAHLAHPGVLVLDGWVRPDEWRTEGQPRPEIADDGETTVVRVTVSRRKGDITDLDMHHLVRTPAGVDYFAEKHRLELVHTGVYIDAMRAAGLETHVIADFMPGRDRVVGRAGA